MHHIQQPELIQLQVEEEESNMVSALLYKYEKLQINFNVIDLLFLRDVICYIRNTITESILHEISVLRGMCILPLSSGALLYFSSLFTATASNLTLAAG